MSRRISLRKRNNKITTGKKTENASRSRKFLNKRIDVKLRSLKLWISVLLIAGLGVLGAGAYLWYNNIFTDEERIFYGMLEKSLETDSITRQITQNEQSRLENQNYFVTFTTNPLVQSKSTVEQIDQNRQKSTVSTETLGTKDADFVRYTNINIPAGSTDKTDYSQVTNIWAKRQTDAESGQNPQFLNEAIFTFILFGNFNQQQKAELLKLIKDQDVYRFGNDGKVTYDNARPLYNVTVSIKPRGLVQVLKKYAEYTGIGDTSMLNPEQYDDKHSFGIQVQIDMLSRHLRQISYPGESRKEVYQAYGLNRNIELPRSAISIEELQSKIQ